MKKLILICMLLIAFISFGRGSRRSGTVHWENQTGIGLKFRNSSMKEKYQQQGRKCALCGKQCSFYMLHTDHIVPYSEGGTMDDSNIRLICGNCHRKKWNIH